MRNRSFPLGTVVPELAYADVFGDGAVVAVEGGTGKESATHGVLAHVNDADAHHARAKRAGARILRPPADQPFGERQYTAVDIGGHRWTFSQTIADIDPASWGGIVPDP